MVDHYQVLGVTKNATKKEVKDAFRRLAIKYHPDKHAQSPDHVRRNATVRFKLVSEAYEVLNDDLKRASYNAGSDSDCFRRTSGSYSNPYGNRGGRAYGYGYGYSTRNRQASSFSSGFDSTFRYLTTRAFLLNLALAGNHSKKQWNQSRNQSHIRMKGEREEAKVLLKTLTLTFKLLL
ncbi:chaperone protein dnaJ 72 isoform X3 [Arabidopsis lyrata subsp. lyrata]|uniref:chaperone protein dnaJ 72 isoform X3 n=1 Tax=Arabidopsis lyrata subsp. lyrata TaxID=81972 RepID=UPI000A29C434|nr:chaperone protein dnaJ 72 isoform X3 [Arabidopsis lyrata subsp. lyrata]|eukprot:XP_020884348.1 chaperone protein dnaJ 72 isoform X3 [Arabidopsis lyrata subsp. lyrata]